MKKLFIRAIWVCICLIPTLMAIIVYNHTPKTPIQSSEISSLTWEGPGGSTAQFWMKEKDGKDFISFLLDLNGNATPIDKLPKDVNTDNGYTATFVTGGVRSVYQYYFSTVSPSNSYVVDPEKYHSIVHAFTKKCMETSKVR